MRTMSNKRSASPLVNSDNLRRSKRRKFNLDVVAAALGNNQKRHRTDPRDNEEGEDDSQQLNVVRDRDNQDPVVACVQNTGDYACTSCPAKYESRNSLSNHMKMHKGEIRKYSCELCNFSSHTQKSLVLHNQVHMQNGVPNAQTSPVVRSTPNIDNPHISNNNDNIASSAPQLIAASEELFRVQDDDREDMGSSSPPILEREDSKISPSLPKKQVSTTSAPSSSNCSVESSNKGRQVAIAVRKSNRSVKLPKKTTPTHTPQKSIVPKRVRTDAKPRALTTQISGSLSNSLTTSSSSSATPPPKSSPPVLNSEDERKGVKRKIVAAAPSSTMAASSSGKIEKEEKPKPEKRPRKGSKATNSNSESPPPEPTRKVSERTTRSTNNHQLMTSNFKALQAPSHDEILEMEKIVDIKMAQPIGRSHYKVRETLGMVKEKEAKKCTECPFKSADENAFARHLMFHEIVEEPRPYQCSDCTFGAFTPSAIVAHVRLHDYEIKPDTVQRKVAKKGKKGQLVTAETATYTCKTCSFRTDSHRSLAEHMAQHRLAFIKQAQINKKQRLNEEYQRPKHKHQPVVRDAKYCKFCTFKTTSVNMYVEHLDRHGCEATFKCHLCDYSDKNKSTVEFHQLHHHIMRDASNHTVHRAMKYRLESGIIQKPAFETHIPTAQEMAMKVRSLLKCRSCEFFCNGPQELAFHMSVNHVSEPGAREMISLLSQGLRPENTEITEV